jgi:hypothetical protein
MVRTAIPLVTALIASVVVVSACNAHDADHGAVRQFGGQLDRRPTGSTPVANAAGSCILHAPSRVAIGRPYIAIPLTMSGDCVNGGYGSWYLYHPTQGSQEVAIFNTGSTDIWDFYRFHTVGLHTWRAEGGWDLVSVDRPQNSPHSDVRLAAGAGISSARFGGVVTLKGTSLLYSVSNNSYFNHSAGGMFQFRERGTTTWKNLRSVRTNSAGVVSMSYRYATVRDYRFTVYSTPISWDLASVVTTR